MLYHLALHDYCTKVSSIPWHRFTDAFLHAGRCLGRLQTRRRNMANVSANPVSDLHTVHALPKWKAALVLGLFELVCLDRQVTGSIRQHEHVEAGEQEQEEWEQW